MSAPDLQGDIFAVQSEDQASAPTVLRRAGERSAAEGRREVIEKVRNELIGLYRRRQGLVRHGVEEFAYVTADDIPAIHARVGHPEAEGKSWYGTVFHVAGWVWTGRMVKSTRDSNHHSDLRCWRYEGA